MDQKNFIYLLNQLEKTGFGRSLESSLRDQMQVSAPAFELNFQHNYGKYRNRMETHLCYRRFDEESRYVFKHFDATLIDLKDQTLRQQIFYVDGPNTITAKEAFNLLEGRCVNKAVYIKNEPVHYTWLALDLSGQSQNGNYMFRSWQQENQFDLEKELVKLPLWELQHEKPKSYLIQHLKKGNLTDATFVEEGKEVKRFLTVRPWDGQILAGDVMPGDQQLTTGVKDQQKPIRKRIKRPVKS